MRSSALIKEQRVRCYLVRDRVRSPAILAELACPAQSDVRRNPGLLPKPPCDERLESFLVEMIRTDHEHIPVARTHRVSPGPASEQPDLLGVPGRDDTVEHYGEWLKVQRPAGAIP